MSRETDKVIVQKQIKRLEEIVRSCPLYLRSEYDLCDDDCPVCRFCWSLQRKDDETAKALNSLEGKQEPSLIDKIIEKVVKPNGITNNV